MLSPAPTRSEHEVIGKFQQFLTSRTLGKVTPNAFLSGLNAKLLGLAAISLLSLSACGSNPVDDVLICCETANGYQTVPASQCGEAQQVSADMCEMDEEVCCKLSDGFQTIPSSECPEGQETSAEMCVDDEEVYRSHRNPSSCSFTNSKAPARSN